MVFDFSQFARDALKSVDSIRSLNANPRSNDNAFEPIESRINTFYRAIGLPAIVSDNKKFPNNNGNIHSIKMTENMLRTFNQREQAFKASISNDIVDSFLDFNTLKLSDSIKFINSSSEVKTPKRRRGSLFPMYVFGDIGVFPQSNRIAGAFFPQRQIIIDQVRYEKPLLELIILLRLKGEGVQNTTLKQAIDADFSESLGEGFVDTTNLNLITFAIIRQLLSTTLSIKDIIRKTIQSLGLVRTQTRIIFKDIKENIPDEQPIFSSTSGTGSLELLKSAQENAINKNSSIFSLLEYDDIADGSISTRNSKEALLASPVLDVLTPSSKILSIGLNETNRQQEKIEQDLKQQFRQMDLLLGVFSGLSGVDILVVIVALFTISQEALLGLLNEEAFQRLRNFKGQGFSPSRLGVQDAVSALEDKVTETFDVIENIIATNNLLESSRIQRGS